MNNFNELMRLVPNGTAVSVSFPVQGRRIHFTAELGTAPAAQMTVEHQPVIDVTPQPAKPRFLTPSEAFGFEAG